MIKQQTGHGKKVIILFVHKVSLKAGGYRLPSGSGPLGSGTWERNERKKGFGSHEHA